MIDAAMEKPPTFNVIVVHSFSRFFRDQFQFEFYLRKLAKNGVKLVSITQDIGDDTMSVMMRKIMTLFDEYQSKENGKHTLRSMKENARQGFWNGARPPIGYRIVVAGQRGAKVKKKLEIDPIQAETVRMMYRMALNGVENSGPMGLKAIVSWLNENNIRTRDGGRWGLGAVHLVLTRTTYIGQHKFNYRDYRTKASKPKSEHAIMEVPPIVTEAEFRAVQRSLTARSPKMMAPMAVGGPTLLTGICFCACCGGAMTLRTGTSSVGREHRYYTCSTRARQGRTGCHGPAVRMDRLDEAMIDFLRSTLLAPERIEALMAPLLTHRKSWTDRRRQHVAKLGTRADEAERKLRNLYRAVENGMIASTDRTFGERVAELSILREQAETEADRVAAILNHTGPVLAMQDVMRMAEDACAKLCRVSSSPRQIVRTLLQWIEIASKDEAHVKGSRGELLKALASATGNRAIMTAGVGGLNWDWAGRNDLEDAYVFRVPI